MRGILGGTFDPPHLAHLVAAETAYRQLGLDRVTFLPAGAPWQKHHRFVSAAEHRLAMSELAVAGAPYFDVDDREVARRGATFTADTLDELEDERVVLILGADAASNLPTWHRLGDVLARADIAIVPRPGVGRSFSIGEAATTVWLDAPELTISGTELRARAKRGLSIRYLVPDPVWRYVEDRALYRDA